MTNLNREATLREVLAEVTVLDIGTALKLILTQFGCLGIAVVFGVAVSQGVGFFASSDDVSLGIPDWTYWLCFLWVFIAIYTSDHSYHDHRFAWYFPKLGWLGSIPLALYVFAAIQLFRAIDPKADWGIKTIQLLLAYLWLVPFVTFVVILEIGHNKLMKKRAESKKA